MGRRTQEERSAATRQLLLDATIGALAELGYQGATAAVIAERAGVTRGAQVHHFGSKDELIAGAVEHLSERRLEQLVGDVRTSNGHGDRVARAIDLLWSAFTGPLAEAAAELWVAARTNPALRERTGPMERRIGALIADALRQVLGHPRLDSEQQHVLELAVQTVRGVAMQRIVLGQTTQQRRPAALKRLVELVRPALERAPVA